MAKHYVGKSMVGLLAFAAALAGATSSAQTLDEFINDPENMLQYHLQNYQTVQVCYEARQDFAVQYTTATDLAQARKAIQTVDQTMTSATPSLNVEVTWQRALSEFGRPETMPAFYRSDPISTNHMRLHRDVLIGNTGKERRQFFADSIRNASARLSREAIGFVCRVALLNLQSAADYYSRSDSSAPSKDF